MDHCTFYNHHLVYDQIVRVVNEHLPHADKDFSENSESKIIKIKQKGGLFGKSRTLEIKYRERTNPSYHLNSVNCPLEQNLFGMLEFVGSIPSKNPEITELFQQKIATINSETVFSSPSGYSKEAVSILKALGNIGSPFLFVQPSKFFKASKNQHFLDNNFQLLLDIRGESQINDLPVEIESHYRDNKITVSASALNRKEYSESILTSHKVQVNKHLPVTEEDVSIRTKEEILDRIYALVTVAAKGEGVQPDQLGAVMERLHITQFSDSEKEMMSKEVLSDQEKANATWRYESLNALLWTIGKIDVLQYPSVICPVEEIVSMILEKTREDFRKETNIRPKDQILDALDLVYRMNWACVNARINNEEPGGNLIPGVVYERHYALNWVVRYQDQDWDHISTDT
ncbi:MAG: DUF4272 domain-containing protein [Bacteroidota bacterium]